MRTDLLYLVCAFHPAVSVVLVRCSLHKFIIHLLLQKPFSQDTTTGTTLKEKNVASFLWSMNNFPDLLERQQTLDQPITSHLFSFNGDRWRGVITPQKDLFLQLVSSVNTIAVDIRYGNCLGETL